MTRDSLRKNRKAASPAVSAVIITSVTVVLVLVTGSYAYQTIERQRGASEFETVNKSILSFDDAVRDVAWDVGGARSTRFTINYGGLELVPNNAEKGLPVNVSVVEFSDANYSDYTGYIRYSISTNYVNLGNGYRSYILGNNKTVVSSGTESLGQAVINQYSGQVITTLNYRVRVMQTYTITVTQNNTDISVSYVDIWIIKMKITSCPTIIGNFDLTARSINVTTISHGGPDGNGYTVKDGQCKILVQLGNEPSDSPILLSIDGEKAVFNFVVAEIEVST